MVPLCQQAELDPLVPQRPAAASTEGRREEYVSLSDSLAVSGSVCGRRDPSVCFGGWFCCDCFMSSHQEIDGEAPSATVRAVFISVPETCCSRPGAASLRGRLDMFVPRSETQQISVRVASHRCVVTPPLLRQLRPEDERESCCLFSLRLPAMIYEANYRQL